MKRLIFLKLGGSLITDKTKPFTAKIEIIKNLAFQISQALIEDKNLQLVIGNGGGSFPHYPAVRYRMKEGIKTEEQKMGFCLVQDAAAQLNRIIVSELLKQSVKACSISPSSIITTENGRIKNCFLDSIIGLLNLGITPVLYGDIVYDEILGSKILSTETILSKLAVCFKKKKIEVEKIIHNGITKGVLDHNKEVIKKITFNNINEVKNHLYKTNGFDVTGGMIHKIEESLELTKAGIESLIINGTSEKDLLKKALLKRECIGTMIS